MTLSELRNLRQNLDSLFYYSFDNLTIDQRQAFKAQIEMIDDKIRSMQDF